jgi:uncharacterized membrane protein YgdD (TMEM256/DUF423 family)
MAGAFGAHALKSRLDGPMLEVWETAARYEAYHALALIALAGIPMSVGRLLRPSAWCFVAGIIIFSGSLYILAITGIKWLGAITPIGGLLLICGWVLLAIAGWRWNSQIVE